jgi:hypothetical protein
MPGPRKTPRHLKLLKGTLQPCRDSPAGVALPALDGVPIPPVWMTDLTAIAEFRRLASVLMANRLLTAGNVALLAHLAMLHARITASWMADETPTAALLTVYRRLSGDLGLTSMPVQAPASKPNRFAEIARRGR